MTADQLERMRSLFTEAQDYPPNQRDAFLDRACPEDPALRGEVAALLRSEEESGDFLEEPAFARGLGLIQSTAAGKLRAGDMVGDYRVVALLGVGGMGEVYLAEDAVHGRQVALKLIGQGRAEEVRGRHFRHERRVLAALNHPHIARLYGSGVTPDGRAYLVMEYVAGERLDEFCAARNLSIAGRLALVRQVGAAVAYAHANLVVHRDLKPANLRVTAEGEPKLLDFGIAKLLEPEGSPARLDPTVTLQGAMTPEYASPEQLQGGPITTASDVYSLGVVLYELLTSQRPFAHLRGRRPDELARAVCEEAPPRPSTVVARSTGRAWVPPAGWRRQLSGDLDNIVAKALQKDPARRYPSVAAFCEDLRCYDAGLPISARRDTLAYRAGKFVGRHKAGVAASALVMVALLVSLAVTLWQARVAGQERDRAQQERDHARIAQRQAERLSDFLETLLGSADSQHAGKDQKVSEVLDAASRDLDRDLAGEPEVLAQAHGTLAHSYNQLGLFVPATEHARAALEWLHRSHNVDDLATVKAELTLADVLTNRFERDEVEPLLRHALEVLRRQPVPDEALLAQALHTLSHYFYYQEQPRQAETAITESLVHAKAAWGEESPRYALYLTGLGTAKLSMHDYAAAESVFRRVLAIQDRTAPGGEHSVPLLMDIGIVCFHQGKNVEARQMLDRLVVDARRLLGEKSFYFAFTTYGYAVLDAVEGNYEVAIPGLQQALLRFKQDFPAKQINVVQCSAILGLCLTRTGRPAEAEPLLRTALADGAEMDREEFNHTVGNLESALGECLLAQQRYAEAEPQLLTGLTDFEKRMGTRHKLTSQARQRLHNLYLAWGKPAEAARYEVSATPQASPAP